jgi:hypothetical protein
MGVKDKAFPGGKLPGFAAEEKDSFPPNDFPLNQSLTKKYGNVKRNLIRRPKSSGKERRGL